MVPNRQTQHPGQEGDYNHSEYYHVNLPPEAGLCWLSILYLEKPANRVC